MRWLCAIALMGASVGCGEVTLGPGGATPTPDRPPAMSDETLRTATDLTFVIDDFNWEVGGSERTTIRHDGSVEHVFYRGRREAVPAGQRAEVGSDEWIVIHWYRARFTLDRPSIDALADVLESQGFRALEPRYVDTSVEDGAQTTYTLTAHGARHEVHCSNLYPPPIRAIAQHVRQRVIEPNQAALDAAPELTEAEARASGALH